MNIAYMTIVPSRSALIYGWRPTVSCKRPVHVHARTYIHNTRAHTGGFRYVVKLSPTVSVTIGEGAPLKYTYIFVYIGMWKKKSTTCVIYTRCYIGYIRYYRVCGSGGIVLPYIVRARVCVCSIPPPHRFKIVTYDFRRTYISCVCVCVCLCAIATT